MSDPGNQSPEGAAATDGALNLDAQHVRDIAAAMGREGRLFRNSGFDNLNLFAGHFGGSSAGQDLGLNYDGAYADSKLQNSGCSEVLDGFEIGLRSAVEGHEETDSLSGLAFRQISVLDPGEATSWRRR